MGVVTLIFWEGVGFGFKKFWPIIKKVGRDIEVGPLKACQDQKIVAEILIKMGQSFFKKRTLRSKSS